MDQSAAQAQLQPAQPPAHRDMMFCHECHDEWYRDQHGLTCPECGSDFTEIIEENHDPRDDNMFNHDHDDRDDDSSIPVLEDTPHHLHHHPLHSDPDEGDISNLQFRQTGPGRFTVTGTMFRTLSPADLGRGGASSPGAGAGAGNGNGPASIGGFASMLTGLLGGARGSPPNQDNNEGSNEGQNTPGTRSGSGMMGGHRFTYTAGARLYPRDADHPGAHVEPVDELNNVLVGLMAALGEPPDPHHHHHFHGGPGDQPHIPVNPFMQLFSQMMGNGQVGDAVYSQEALDRIISQLMEQTATSNAPGPAPQKEIDSLPRKKVDVEMLGPEGRAECSICMEEVNIGEEVTELPCHHWFHHPCVAAWLGEHNTCPHCRKGITKQAENAGNQDQGNNINQGASESAPNRAMPGSFNVHAESTTSNPLIVQGSSSPSNEPACPDGQARSGAVDEANSGGGLGERLRRSWFGPPS